METSYARVGGMYFASKSGKLAMKEIFKILSTVLKNSSIINTKIMKKNFNMYTNLWV
jgi:hypothetical protein